MIHQEMGDRIQEQTDAIEAWQRYADKLIDGVRFCAWAAFEYHYAAVEGRSGPVGIGQTNDEAIRSLQIKLRAKKNG